VSKNNLNVQAFPLFIGYSINFNISYMDFNAVNLKQKILSLFNHTHIAPMEQKKLSWQCRGQINIGPHWLLLHGKINLLMYFTEK